jgi:hypothetical protein
MTGLSGITFKATQVPSSDANTLDDYEEGTWTPTANGISYATGTTGKYTKVGNLVTCTFIVVFPTTADTNSARIQSLPFTANSNSASTFGNYSNGFNGALSTGNGFISLINPTGTGFITNVTLSGQTLVGSISYQI